VAVESKPVQELVFCALCGRLMADEPGPLCDHCSPPPAPVVVVKAPPDGSTFVTWSLIVVTAATSVAAVAFADEQFPLGANFGPNVAGGQWWRLLTAIFCHYTLGHYVWNMIPLGLLGSKLERILGHWVFLSFYLACGLTGSILSLFLSPEVPSAGASGAIFGVCAGLFVLYAMRFRELTHRQRNKLACLGIYTGYGIWTGLFDAHVDSGDHIGGLAAGVVLGLIVCRRFSRPAIARRWIMLAAALAIVVGAWSFRQTHLYLVHLDAAARALKTGELGVAEAELRIAREMEPGSPLGRFLEQKLEQEQTQ
jgi:rhomboid protease GluP